MGSIATVGRLNERLSFIKTIKKKNDFGEWKTFPQVIHTCWAKEYTRYMNDIQATIGTVLEDTVTMIIRYKQKIEIKNDMEVEYKGESYSIIKIVPDGNKKDYTTIIMKRVT